MNDLEEDYDDIESDDNKYDYKIFAILTITIQLIYIICNFCKKQCELSNTDYKKDYDIQDEKQDIIQPENQITTVEDNFEKSHPQNKEKDKNDDKNDEDLDYYY